MGVARTFCAGSMGLAALACVVPAGGLQLRSPSQCVLTSDAAAARNDAAPYNMGQLSFVAGEADVLGWRRGRLVDARSGQCLGVADEASSHAPSALALSVCDARSSGQAWQRKSKWFRADNGAPLAVFRHEVSGLVLQRTAPGLSVESLVLQVFVAGESSQRFGSSACEPAKVAAAATP